MLSLSVFLKKSLTFCLLRFFSTHISKVICGISNVFVCVVWYPSDRQVYRTENKFNKGLIFFIYIFYISNLYFYIYINCFKFSFRDFASGDLTEFGQSYGCSQTDNTYGRHMDNIVDETFYNREWVLWRV